MSHQVIPADTTTTITSDTPDPSTVGQAVTVNFVVAAAAPGAGTPAGNVTVSDGVDACTATVATGSCSVSLTTAGARTLTATYAGNANFNASTSTGQPHTVNGVTTTTTITSDTPDPSVVGQAVAVHYSVVGRRWKRNPDRRRHRHRRHRLLHGDCRRRPVLAHLHEHRRQVADGQLRR